MLELLALKEMYEKIYIAYYNQSSLLPTKNCVLMLWSVLKHFGDKYQIITVEDDFTQVSQIPKQFTELGASLVVTTSNQVYGNLASKGISVRRLIKAKGFHDIYQQLAYQQGYILDNLQAMFKGR